GDVTGVLTKTANDDYSLSQRNVYSPYGMVWHAHSVASLPWYQRTLTGFNGEQTDPATGWQFLGTGHRTYNPSQRYFVSEDPAGDGYAFGSNNPIMNTDPSGNFPKWMGGMMHILRHVGTLGLDHFHKKWANIIGITAVVAIACVAIAASIIAGGEVTPMLATAAGLTFLLRWTCNSISCCSHKQRLKHCQHGCWFLSRSRRYCSNTS
ncbi:MAG: RHS repeat-associated core domain-containing protein, partial [Endozoicomonadaceae bacterium]|nr:RHS repeat-associated core domain-containing protein [Endozoicomonadaceae bacterium]